MFLVHAYPNQVLRTWVEHVQSIMLYCLVHYFRGITAKYGSHEMRHKMSSIPNLESERACYEVLKEIEKYDGPDGSCVCKCFYFFDCTNTYKRVERLGKAQTVQVHIVWIEQVLFTHVQE